MQSICGAIIVYLRPFKVIFEKCIIIMESREKKIEKVTLWGSFVNLVLLVFKFVAGFVGNSGAMIADAVHSLSDFVTDIIVLLFVNISSKPKDESHEYGHGKYETLATSVIGIILLCVGFGLFWESFSRIWNFFVNDVLLEEPGYIALVAAVASIVVKEALYQYTIRVGKQVNSQAVVANAWHHRSDAFSSIGTMIGIGGAILLGENWRILDPLAALVVSIFIVRVSLLLLYPAINDLLEVSLPKETEQHIIAIIMENPHVSKPHNLYTRRIGNTIAIEAHIRVDGSVSVRTAHEWTREIEQKLRVCFGEKTHIMLHVEPLS